MADPIKLPPGATLVSDGSQSMPLPPGATLVSQVQMQTQQPQQQPGVLQRLGESFGIPQSMEELKAAAPQSFGDVVNMLDPGAIATKVIQNYAHNTGQGFKQGFQEAGEADQLRKQGLISTKQAVGKTASAALNATVNAIPIVGPTAVSMGEDIARHNYRGAIGSGLGIAAQVLSPALPTKVNPNSLLGRMLLLGKTPEGAYESALKPSTTLGAAERTKIAQTGLQEGIPVSQKGFQKLGDLIDNVNQDISKTIASDPNRPVNTAPAVQNLSGVRQRFANQVNPRSDMQAIQNAADEFTQTFPGQIPAEQAQAVKQGTYRALGDKAYGEISTASKESQKALARGLKDELAQQFPELSNLNARDSRLINLQDSLERAVGRIGNHQLLGIGTPIAAGAVKAVSGSGKLAAIAGVMKAVLDNPSVKSNLAIALSQGRIPSPLVVPKIAAYAGALGRLSQPSKLPFLPGSQQTPAPSANQ